MKKITSDGMVIEVQDVQPESLLGELLKKPVRREDQAPKKESPTPFIDDLRKLRESMYDQYRGETYDQSRHQYMKMYEAQCLSTVYSRRKPLPDRTPDGLCGVCFDPNCPYSKVGS